MKLLEKASVGNSVRVNLELSNDRLTKDIVDAINISSIGTIIDFRITDGKGIGVIIKLSNGKEQWFFEDEIDLLDEDGNVVEKDTETNVQNNLIFQMIKNLKYKNKTKTSNLLNPINFIIWLIVSTKDIF